MKDKDLPLDNNLYTLEELTAQANRIIKSLEKEKDLSSSIENYQELLRLNKAIEKKFHRNFKNITEETTDKIKKIISKNAK
jgi:hypothetical protein